MRLADISSAGETGIQRILPHHPPGVEKGAVDGDGAGHHVHDHAMTPEPCRHSAYAADILPVPLQSSMAELSRATFIPCRINRSKTASDREAGPIVHTILVLWVGNLMPQPPRPGYIPGPLFL
jgi:hypothetical protein